MNNNTILKISTFTDTGECNRQDINDLIASLVRMGYEVWLNDDYICFNVGFDDKIEQKGERE